MLDEISYMIISIVFNKCSPSGYMNGGIETEPERPGHRLTSQTLQKTCQMTLNGRREPRKGLNGRF